MTKTHKNYLRVFPEQTVDVVRPELEAVKSLPAVLEAFGDATGWSLEYVSGALPKKQLSYDSSDTRWSTPVDSGLGSADGHLVVDMTEDSANGRTERIDCQAARRLAASLGQMLGELQQTQNSLWQREAELAAGVPLVAMGDGERHLAARLEAVLQGGADAVDAQAAALYLLDEGTSELKLRSCWGLSRNRLLQPARPLQGELADLEALLGHAVVLENKQMMEQWRAPEKFAAAVCIPVSSPTTILGTIWIFSDKPRDFTSAQTNMIEVVAGRIAADLEREMLLQEGVDGAKLKQQAEAAGRMQRGGLPSVSPLLDGWQMAGWTAQADSVGGDFFDWFSLPEGRVALSVGDALNEGMEAALSASVVRTAVRSHAQYQQDVVRLLCNVNLTLWTGSAGDQSVNLFCGLVNTSTGQARFASAGQVSVLLLGADGWRSLSQPSTALGTSPESRYQAQEYELQFGESLLVFTNGFRDAADQEGRPLGERGLGDPLAKTASRMSAGQIVDFARDRLESHAIEPEKSDRTVMVIKRTQP